MPSKKKLPTDVCTETEKDILDFLLERMRRANKTGEQLNIVYDPFIVGSGAHVFVAYSEAGESAQFEGAMMKRNRAPKRVRIR